VILAMDTSSPLTSVALVDGDQVVAERSELDARRHAEVLAPLLLAVLEETGAGPDDVTTIACGIGPGPYTGLRVAIASARALGLAWSRPVVGVCSLDAIATAVVARGGAWPFGVASDARRREVYWAWFDENGERVVGPQVLRPQEIAMDLRSGRWAGHGAAEHADSFGTLLGDDETLSYPVASWIARRAGALLAAGVTVERAGIELSAHGGDGEGTSHALAGLRLLVPEPLYLRRPDAAESAPALLTPEVTS
jgi:tRNA threonylcarbamoyladenosine biosynthesis protein TsaB